MAGLATAGAGAELGERKINTSSGFRLAAAPTFLLMGGISAINAPAMTICTTALPWSSISEMALMYLLMGVFHLPPWLPLVSARFSCQTEGD